MLTYAWCWRMLYADVCWRMQTYADGLGFRRPWETLLGYEAFKLV
jgi:hypothetical protein